MLTAPLLVLLASVAQATQEPRLKPEDLEPIAKIGIQRVLSNVLEVPVAVGEVKLLPDQGRMELHDVRVANPDGFEIPDAFTAQNVLIEGDTQSLFSRSPEIKLIEVTGAKVDAETKLPQGNNLQKLLSNAKSVRQGALQGRIQKQWRIQKAVMKDAEVNVGTQLIESKNVQKKLDSLEMDFMGENGQGMPANEAVAKFLTRLVQEMDLLSAVAPPGTEGIVNKVLPELSGVGSKPAPEPGRRPGSRLRDLLNGLGKQ